MKGLSRLLAVCLLVAALVALVAAAGGAQSPGGVLTVEPGESIQAAVNAADPGDTVSVLPGTYRQTVVIRKDNIRLVGVRATLRPPARSTSPCGPSGICILGRVDFDTGQVARYVSNVTVSGFTVQNFQDTGIIAVGARNAAMTNNLAAGNGEYGIAAFVSTGTRITSNLTTGSDEAGVYVGDSPRARATITNNRTSGNFLGVFIRNARQGVVSGNRVAGNCLGVLVLADAPGPAGNFEVRGNKVRNNSRACAGDAEEGVPPISGVGVALLGARGMEVRGNDITGNTPTGPSAFSGGVVVVRSLGGTAPANNAVIGNRILNNDPDIFWDRSGTNNRFAGNNCWTSVPARLCRG